MHSVILRRFIPTVHTIAGELCQARCVNTKTGVLDDRILEHHRTSPLSENREIKTEIKEKPRHQLHKERFPLNFRESNPEFLPGTDWSFRDRIREMVERRDMYKRRRNIYMPEFYVGSILAVTVADPHAPGKSSRFLGICIHRGECGLRHQIILRNVIDQQGIEVMYEIYSPLVQKIEVIRLEKRLDKELFYLRDCPLEYSTFPQNMDAQMIHKNVEVPVNDIKVPLGPRPWSERWERANLEGVQNYMHLFKSKKGFLKNMIKRKHPQVTRPWEKEDIMKHYRESIDPETSGKIYKEVLEQTKNWPEK